MPRPTDLKGDHEEEVRGKHDGGYDSVYNLGRPALRVRLEWAFRRQLDTQPPRDDSQDDEDATEPEVGAAYGGPAGCLGALAGFDFGGAFLVDAVVDVAQDGLEEGEGEDGQTHARMRVVPNAVVFELLGEPDA